jgi:hypothetical protein
MYQVELPEVQKYCDNRTEYLTQIHESREEAKQAIIKVFYNGKNDYMLLAPIVTEIRSFIKNYLMTDPIYAELLAYVRSKEANTYGSFLSHILQTEERKVMIAIRQSFMVQGFNVDVLTYDGVMVRKGVKRIAEENLRIAEEDIFHATRYRIQLLNKPFDFFKMDDLFQTKTETLTICNKCHHENKIVDISVYIMIDNDINECIETKRTIENYQCDLCKEKVNATIISRLTETSEIIIFTFNKYSINL